MKSLLLETSLMYQPTASHEMWKGSAAWNETEVRRHRETLTLRLIHKTVKAHCEVVFIIRRGEDE